MARRRLVTLSAAVYGGLALAALVWGLVAGRPWLVAYPEPWLSLHPLAAHGLSLGLGLAFAVLTVWVSRVLSTRFAAARAMHAGFRELLGEVDGRAILVLALTSGIGEELFFRGAMQPTVGWIGTSLIFGLIHIGPDRRFLLWTPFAVLAGLAFGAIHAATGSLLGAILAHVWINHENLAFIVAHDPASPDEGDRSDQPDIVSRSERR